MGFTPSKVCSKLLSSNLWNFEQLLNCLKTKSTTIDSVDFGGRKLLSCYKPPKDVIWETLTSFYYPNDFFVPILTNRNSFILDNYLLRLSLFILIFYLPFFIFFIVSFPRKKKRVVPLLFFFFYYFSEGTQEVKKNNLFLLNK